MSDILHIGSSPLSLDAGVAGRHIWAGDRDTCSYRLALVLVIRTLDASELLHLNGIAPEKRGYLRYGGQRAGAHDGRFRRCWMELAKAVAS